MPTIINLEERVTFNYDSGWADEDEWRTVGRAKVLGRKVVDAGDADRNGVVYLHTAKVSRGVKPETAIAALQDMFTSSCRHEHDCCGCAFTVATARRTGRSTYSVRVRRQINI